MKGDSEVQCALSVCVCVCWVLVHTALWLFVRATCLKTGSLTGRQDVAPWTFGNRAAPSEPSLKQDGFVHAIAILPPPPPPQPTVWGCSLRQHAPGAPLLLLLLPLTSQQLRSCCLQGTEVTSEQPDLHWDQRRPRSLINGGLTSERVRPADGEQHVTPQVGYL